jgi:plasmid stabilization system protein ParE
VIDLRISEAAAVSIIDQADYYLQAADASLAQRWEQAVDEAVGSLLNLPERGTLCRFRSSTLAGLRWISIPGFPKHLILYRTVREEHAILIVQVLHGARNLETILNDEV